MGENDTVDLWKRRYKVAISGEKVSKEKGARERTEEK
jgi:hypothetical protein